MRTTRNLAPRPPRCAECRNVRRMVFVEPLQRRVLLESRRHRYSYGQPVGVEPGTGTNWVANAIANGITVTTGAIQEPTLAALVHPSGSFRDLFQGANVGDALFRNTAFLKWEILYIGDPLYRPFPNGLPPFAKKGIKAPPKVEQPRGRDAERTAEAGDSERAAAIGVGFQGDKLLIPRRPEGILGMTP